MLDLDTVARAIHGTRESLAASGYAIDCTQPRDGALAFTVRALEGACEECLVPRSIFTAILADELREGGITASAIDVVYPLAE